MPQPTVFNTTTIVEENARVIPLASGPVAIGRGSATLHSRPDIIRKQKQTKHRKANRAKKTDRSSQTIQSLKLPAASAQDRLCTWKAIGKLIAQQRSTSPLVIVWHCSTPNLSNDHRISSKRSALRQLNWTFQRDPKGGRGKLIKTVYTRGTKSQTSCSQTWHCAPEAVARHLLYCVRYVFRCAVAWRPIGMYKAPKMYWCLYAWAIYSMAIYDIWVAALPNLQLFLY